MYFHWQNIGLTRVSVNFSLSMSWNASNVSTIYWSTAYLAQLLHRKFVLMFNTGTSCKSQVIGEYRTIAGICWSISTACTIATGKAMSPGCEAKNKNWVKTTITNTWNARVVVRRRIRPWLRKIACAGSIYLQRSSAGRFGLNKTCLSSLQRSGWIWATDGVCHGAFFVLCTRNRQQLQRESYSLSAWEVLLLVNCSGHAVFAPATGLMVPRHRTGPVQALAHTQPPAFWGEHLTLPSFHTNPCRSRIITNPKCWKTVWETPFFKLSC